MNQKGFALIVILLSATALVIIGAGVYLISLKGSKIPIETVNSNTISNRSTSTPTTSGLLPQYTQNNETLNSQEEAKNPPVIDYSTWKTYTSSIYKFSLKYPSDIAPNSVPSPYPESFSTPKLPVPLQETRLTAQALGATGNLVLNIYPPIYQTLDKNTPMTEPCGSQYGKVMSTEVAKNPSGVTYLYRGTFHDEDTSPILNIYYGDRLDYCFISGSGNLIVLRGVTGTLNAGYEIMLKNYDDSIMSTVDIN